MAKRRKSRKSRRRKGTGSTIVTRRVNGLGKLSNPKSTLGAMLPPLLGGAMAAGATIIVRRMAERSAGEDPSSLMAKASDYAPWLGVAVGGLGALAMSTLVGKPAAMSAAAGAIGVGGALALKEALDGASAVSGPYGRHGYGAVVAEEMPRGMGAIVMEPSALSGVRDPRGENVSLGNVNTEAFGTPAYAL